MNEIDVNHYLTADNQIKQIYKGVIGSNELFLVDKSTKSIYIANTDPNYLPGTHWVAIYSHEETCEIFDSLGNKPSTYGFNFSNLTNNYQKYTYSTAKIQNSKSTLCGVYCIFYCYLKSRGFKMGEILEYFSTDTEMNDYLMRSFMSKFSVEESSWLP